ncbi:MAG TPA: cellulase family glycosylhydrolase, partial [Pontiella sp.]|nr:cellulase family glycosylhydrolase [Pontiella sp.]
KYKIYVIIDMHGAPGGQTGQNIDDSPEDLPGLFMDTDNQDRLVDLWVKIADRYKDETIVAAYDLLNEPLPARTGAAGKYKNQLEPLYKRITKAIRKVDKNHMITLEGADWSNDWSVFTEPFDDNVFYQFHYYCWNKPDQLNGIEDFIARRKELNTPVWVGETGEKGKTIYWGTTQYFEHNNIGWSFWPWKKMDTINTPYSIRKPAGWDAIAEYSRGGEKPDTQLARRALDELLENIKLENCDYFPDVVNAIFRRVPGKVEAENYGHKGLQESYYVKDTSRTAEFYRTAEPVPVEIIGDTEKARVSEQCIRLVKNEWTAYDVNCLNAMQCNATVRVKAAAAPARLEITSNGQTSGIELTDTEWTEKEAGAIAFKEGGNSIKIKVLEGKVLIDWFEVE